MAIKGKKRSRGGRTRVAAAPRPVFVTPKKPLVQRIWFRTLVLAILVGTVAAAGFFFWQERRAAAEEEAAREDVARLGVAIETALIGAAQPAGQSLVVMPEIGQTLVEFQTGEIRERRVLRRVEDFEQTLRAADERLAAIQTERAQARQAITRMREGLAQYQGVVADIPGFLELEDEDEQRDAAIRLTTGLEEAGATFNTGWLIFLTLRSEVGLDQPAPEMDPVFPGTEPGLPPGFDPGMLPEDFDPEQLPDEIPQPEAEE